MKIGYQGSIGSYSYEASQKIIQHKLLPTTSTLIGHTLSEDVINSLIKGDIDYAVLPVENSIIGNIDINTELIQNNPISADFEFHLRIKHVLYAEKKIPISDIKKVYSHPAALAQCHDFISKNKMTPMVEFDTGGACQKLTKGKYPKGTAVIAGPHCEQLLNVVPINMDIQKSKENFTRFLLLKKTSQQFNLDSGDKFSLSFSANNNPGALLEVLSYFRELKINLTKLESMPIPDNPFCYTFFVDGDLIKNNFEQSQILLQNLIGVLTENQISFKLIGIYPTHNRADW